MKKSLDRTSIKGLLAAVGLFLLSPLAAQTISTLDIVKVNGQYEQEALYFYHENWLAFRKEAMKEKAISGYEMLRAPSDSAGFFHLMLLTQYPDSASFRNMESSFAPIMKRVAPNGPKMLNDVPRSKFLEYVSGHDLASLASSQPAGPPSEKALITATLMDYIEGTANGEPDRLRRAFHPDFNLYTVTEEGSLRTRDGQEYIAGVKPGEKANRIGRIVSIDVEKDAATAKVEIEVPNWRIFTDYFLLLKYEGSWKIVHKSYTWRELPKQAGK